MDIFELYPNLHIVHHKDENHRLGCVSYVNRNNPICNKLKEILRHSYPKYAIDYTPDLRKENLDIKSLYCQKDRKLCIEIGFGKGDSTYEQAKSDNEYNYLCFDVYMQGFANLLSLVAESNLKNILLCHYDAVDFIKNSVYSNYVDKFNLFFPDPWPKTKQKKRRIINQSNTLLFVDKLSVGGIIHVATDIQDYAEQVLECFNCVTNLKNKYSKFAPTEVRTIKTFYEKKAISEGRKIFDIIFEKIYNLFYIFGDDREKIYTFVFIDYSSYVFCFVQENI